MLGPALRTQPDKRLVALVREGYEAAFEEIVRRYDKALGRYAAAIVGGRSEDVTQDAFSKALLALRRDDAEIELRPWLYRIVRNTALNDLRDRPAAAEELADAIAGGNNPAEELEQREELADLMKRLRALPESQRAAIVMRELEGLSHEEIAAALGLSGGAARQAIHRARTALRNGAGLLLPLPLMRFLIDHADAATAGASVGTATVAGGAVSGAGAGALLKAGVVTAVLAGSVGTGVALHENRDGAHANAAATAPASGEEPGGSTSSGPPPRTNAAVAVGTGVAEDSGGGERGKSGGRDGLNGNVVQAAGGNGIGRGPGPSPASAHRGSRHPGHSDGPSGPRPIHRREGGGTKSGPGPRGGHLGAPGDQGAPNGPGGGRAGNRGPGGDGSSGSIQPPPPRPTPGDDSSGEGDGSRSGFSGSGDDLP